jgi:peroxiredoxin Q/BCP
MLVGQPAPNFSLADKDGRPHSLNDFSHPYLVIYFYPKDDTPGCSIEAKEFSDALNDLSASGIGVVGISGGTNETKAKFCSKLNLTVTLLSDTDFSVAKAYGVFGPKKYMGKTYEGIFRHTFVLDKSRKIIKHFTEVSLENHVPEVKAFVLAHASGAIPEETREELSPTKLKRTTKKPMKKTTTTKKPAAAKKEVTAKKTSATTPAKKVAKANATPKKAVKKATKPAAKKATAAKKTTAKKTTAAKKTVAKKTTVKKKATKKPVVKKVAKKVVKKAVKKATKK